MARFSKLVLSSALFVVAATSAWAQSGSTGDNDDQFVISGCVARPGEVRDAGPHSMMVWSKGDVYLASPSVRVKPSDTTRSVGTAGTSGALFYWLDDEDDFSKYVGQRVEIVGELSDEIDRAEIELTPEGDFTEIEFDSGGREAEARVPSSWLGPSVRGKDVDVEISFRSVDVEKVTPLGPCVTR